MTLFTFLTSLGCTAILERQEWSQSLATCQKNHMIKPRLKSQTFGLPLPWVIIFCFPLVYLSHSETHNFESVCHECLSSFLGMLFYFEYIQWGLSKNARYACNKWGRKLIA